MTIVHELSHGLTALLTGGAFLRFVVFPDGSGLAYTAGGLRLLVVSAGYLGSALFGAALVLIGRRPVAARRTAYAIGALLPLLALRYGLPSLISADWLGGLLTVVAGVTLGGAFLWVAARASAAVVSFLLNLVAFQSALLACSDLLTLIGITTSVSQSQSNDAQSMAKLVALPAAVWAVIWAALALLLLGAALWRTWGRAPAP